MSNLSRYTRLSQIFRVLVLASIFLVPAGLAWGQVIIEGLPESVCKNDPPYPLVPVPAVPDPGATYVFSGPGVTGNMSSGFFYNPASDEVPVGIAQINLAYRPSQGPEENYIFEVDNRFVPTLDFSTVQACILADGGLVQFNNLTSGKFSVATWYWNFGDPPSGSSNVSIEEAPDHFYPSPGSWTVTLSATTVDGCSALEQKTIELADEPDVDFTWLSDCYIRQQETGFINRTRAELSDLTNLVWTFRTTGGGVLGQIPSTSPEDTIYYPFAALDDYFVTLQVQNAAGCTGTLTKPLSFKSIYRVPVSGYLETFDDGTDWLVQSEDWQQSWVLGEPDFTGFDPVPGDLGWYTSLPVHTTGYLEKSWVQSQCFDLTQLSSPLILLDVMKSFVPGMDGAVFQYQDMVSEGWKTVGVVGAGQNWYNSWGLFNEPGGSSFGWGLPLFEPDEAWVPAGYPIDDLAGLRAVKFRVAIGTGGRQAIGNQGFAFDNFFIGQRARFSVLEHFTNSASLAATDADGIVEKFVADHSDVLIDVQYHMDYPGDDPMNQNNPLPPSARAFNYGVPGVPYAILNGGAGPEYRYDFSDESEQPDEEVLLAASLEISPFDLLLDVDFRSSRLVGSAKASCATTSYSSNIQLYVVVIEEEVTAYVGAGNTSLYRNVVLDMVPTSAGKLLGNDWSAGDAESLNFSWDYASYVEDLDDLAVIAFLFDRDVEKVLQASIVRASPGTGVDDRKNESGQLSLFPNPAQETIFLSLGLPAEKEGQIMVMDLAGRKVLEVDMAPGLSIRQLDVSGLAEGVYLVHWMESGLSRGKGKFVISR